VLVTYNKNVQFLDLFPCNGEARTEVGREVVGFVSEGYVLRSFTKIRRWKVLKENS
jgi:hypothetical protein